LQVYVEMRVVPVTPADVYTMRLGGLYDDQSKEPPFVAGHEGVGVVLKVRNTA
jgi:NADPH:quinone reductase-like Zn-dependent oxidoreductase